MLTLTRSGQPAEPESEAYRMARQRLPTKTPKRTVTSPHLPPSLTPAVERGMELLANASGQEEQIGYALNLRYLQNGWTAELREMYFNWFVLSGNYKGARLANYLADIKKHATESVPENDMTALTELINTPLKIQRPVHSRYPLLRQELDHGRPLR